MGKFFNMDNPFFVAMGKVADLFILNMVFIVCCIPIVTIGPAITAMFYVTLKMAKNEESYILRSFFHSFRQNLKQGILIHIIMMAIAFLLLGDFYITAHMTGKSIQIMRALLLVVVAFYALEYLYLYPVLSKFDNTIKNTFRNSLIMSIRHLPQTVLIAIVSFSPLLVLLVKDAAVQSTILFVFILLGPAAISYANSHLFVKVFAHYIPEEEPVPELTGDNPDFGVYTSVASQTAEQDVYAKFRDSSSTAASKEIPEEAVSDKEQL